MTASRDIHYPNLTQVWPFSPEPKSNFLGSRSCSRTAVYQVGARLMLAALLSSPSVLHENHLSFKQHISARAGSPLATDTLHNSRGTPHHEKGGTPEGRKAGMVPGLTPQVSLECNPEIPVAPGEEH